MVNVALFFKKGSKDKLRNEAGEPDISGGEVTGGDSEGRDLPVFG